MLEFVNASFLEIFFRFLKQAKGKNSKSESITRWSTIINVVQWFLRAVLFLVCVFQFVIVVSKSGSYCTSTTGLLLFENQWLLMLVVLQMVKVTATSLW